MYDRLTKLLEAELLRTFTDETSPIEYRDGLSISSSVPETHQTEKTASDRSIHLNQPVTNDTPSDTKSSSTRVRKTLDELEEEIETEEERFKRMNPYRWFIEKQREEQQPKDLTEHDEQTSAMVNKQFRIEFLRKKEKYFQEERLRFVAEDFCNWLHKLGGEAQSEIDPAVVRNLFSTAYDTKPSLSVPIKIVEMTRVKT